MPAATASQTFDQLLFHGLTSALADDYAALQQVQGHSCDRGHGYYTLYPQCMLE